MPSENKTPNIGLNQWQGNEYPKRQDFVDDNLLIDTKIKEIADGAVATIGDIQDLQQQISDLQAFVGYTDDDIMGVEVYFVNRKFTRLAGAVNRTPGAGFDDVKAFGGRKRCNLTDGGKVIAYYGDAGYSENGSNGQVMVEQPKFYY